MDVRKELQIRGFVKAGAIRPVDSGRIENGLELTHRMHLVAAIEDVQTLLGGGDRSPSK